jgi:hypothetical protein
VIGNQLFHRTPPRGGPLPELRPMISSGHDAWIGHCGFRGHGQGLAVVRARYLIDKSALARMSPEPVRRRIV